MTSTAANVIMVPSLVSAFDKEGLERFRTIGFAPTNKVIVLALRAPIEAALARGYRLKEVHGHLVSEGVLSSDYSSFRRTVRAHIGGGRSFPPRS